MPNRFSKSAAEFGAAHGATTITPASVAQASSLHHLIPKISISKRTGGVSPPKLNRRLRPPKSKRRLKPPHSTYRPPYRGAPEISGANLMYEGARVKSWMLGRDVNPAGRGDGSYYAQGGFSIGSVRPSPTTKPVAGWGNSLKSHVIGSKPNSGCTFGFAGFKASDFDRVVIFGARIGNY